MNFGETPVATFYPKPPYSFKLLLDVLTRYAHPAADVTHDGAYWRAIRIQDSMALVRVTAGGTLDSPELTVELVAHGGDIDHDTLNDVMRHILAADRDESSFYAFARQDKRLWPVIEPVVGLPELRTASAFEALTQAIIEQQIAWSTAQRAQRWLVEWADNRITYRGRDYFTFPTPEQIANATVDDLTPLKITFKRIGLLIDIARQITTGRLDLEGLRGESPDTAYTYLLKIKGIGHWTAAVILARAFGCRDYVGYNDVALQAAVNRYFYGGKGRIPAQMVADTFAPYGEFTGTVAYHTLLRWVLDQYPPVR